ALAFAPRLRAQTALQPPAIVPSGRVCTVKAFGAPTATGLVDPIFFANPGAIALDPDSNLYSTSPSGGKKGAGTVFRSTPHGDVSLRHNFAQFDPKNGSGPQSGLIDGKDGYFWGTTYSGGLGVGTIFRIRPGDTSAEIRFRFRNGSVLGLLPDCPTHKCPYTPRQRADIAAGYPSGPPVMASGGSLYGVTAYSNNQIYGTLYRFDPPYDSTTFHAVCIFDQRLLADKEMAPFACKTKGGAPSALLLGPDGMLYGTLMNGNGSVFRATTGGGFTILHEFDLTQGSKPYNLILASNGRLYGTTSNGGDTGGGIVYGVDTSGSGFKMMTSFRVGTSLQGLNPAGGLVEAKPRGSLEPFLFGTTKYGGKLGRGILFRIPLDGDSLSLRVLHDFDMYTTGRMPVTAPVLGAKGLLYGLTYQGGTYDKGVLYTLDPIVLNDNTSHDSYITSVTRSVDDKNVLLSDPIASVWINATSAQGANSMTGGITVRGLCPNAHIVQFIYRERISAQGVALPGTMDVSAGNYPLTTSLNDIHWHTDTPPIDLKPGQQRNAYLDQALGAGHTVSPVVVAIFDKPTFGVYDDPNRASAVYLPSGQNPDVKLSETWRATARDFLVCNCQVTKEIWWSREVRGGKSSFAHIRIANPAADALSWINAQLKSDGYATIP
ncbi:MAG: hypothetical protein M3081_13690, partial [Gemmatimonadota bacterium]|nr:hypothetical protein [Gemmatimonadota bacterium]